MTGAAVHHERARTWRLWLLVAHVVAHQSCVQTGRSGRSAAGVRSAVADVLLDGGAYFLGNDDLDLDLCPADVAFVSRVR